MIIDLTLRVAPDSPLVAWAKKQRNPYVAMGHIGTHLDTYERRPIPLEYFKSRGVLFDVRGIGEVQLSDIDLDLVRRGDFVLFRTDVWRNTPMARTGILPPPATLRDIDSCVARQGYPLYRH